MAKFERATAKYASLYFQRSWNWFVTRGTVYPR